MPRTPTRFADIVRVLEHHGVEYVVVGALAATLQGAPVTTFDMDIVHRRDPENVRRLVTALKSIHAYYWEHINKRLEPEERTLLLKCHHLLTTDFGDIDVLGAIGQDEGFDELSGRICDVPLESGVSAPVLELEAVIRTKREAGRPKDLAMLPVLEETLREIRRRQHAEG